jgi:murein DD-endopeptidase MepM/ murein hydrolase activator NlpD
MRKTIFACLLFGLIFALVPATRSYAQEGEVDGPVYVVQAGDTLFNIALKFGVTIDSLIEVNQLIDPNQLNVGEQVIIPGLEGVKGVLTTAEVGYGESLLSLSRRYRIPLPSLSRLNRVVSPKEIFVGSEVILPFGQSSNPPEGRALLKPSQTMLELSVAQSTDSWTLTVLNELDSSVFALPGDVLTTLSPETSGPGALPESIRGVEIPDLPMVQGEAATILVGAGTSIEVSGELTVLDLRSGNPITSTIGFFPLDNGQYAALPGIHAMAKPGFYPLKLTFRQPDGYEYSFSQNIYVTEGGYVFDPTLQVPPETIDPANTGPEDELWNKLGKSVSPEKMWSGLFQSPAVFPDCWTSRFGSRRSYNGGPYNYFHTGLDFCGGVGLEVRAPAPGVVTFAGPLVVRGNAVMVDHGWGINTGYMHLSEILVKEGDRVETGQLIGLVGGTGRVTGAHLHWEVWAGGVQVDPVPWLEMSFPQEGSSSETSSPPS